jgi:uncharacterized cupin superfamily protein
MDTRVLTERCRRLSEKKLGAAVGSQKLGCSLMELAPGKRSWPPHAHFANEEALYILKGQGKVRIVGHVRRIHRALASFFLDTAL